MSGEEKKKKKLNPVRSCFSFPVYSLLNILLPHREVGIKFMALGA